MSATTNEILAWAKSQPRRPDSDPRIEEVAGRVQRGRGDAEAEAFLAKAMAEDAAARERIAALRSTGSLFLIPVGGALDMRLVFSRSRAQPSAWTPRIYYRFTDVAGRHYRWLRSGKRPPVLVPGVSYDVRGRVAVHEDPAGGIPVTVLTRVTLG